MKFHITSLLRHGRLVAAALLCVMLSACGGDRSPAQDDPWTSFTQQQLQWDACDPTIMGEGENDLTQLGGRAQCALMRAPLNYDNLALGELQVALLRVAAEQPQQRLGAIFFNPGGPGGDGLGFASRYGVLWSNANSEDSTGRLLKELSNKYDLIGFSPRGVGSSSTLFWYSPELFEVQNDLTFDRSAQNLQNALRNARLLVKASTKNPLSQYVNTDATARDMDLMRELLGDRKINYVGYSYGTWLGAWYASLFPEHVGHMLLDSSMNITASFSDAGLAQEMGRQRVIDEVMLPYVTSHPELFNLGNSVTELRNRLLALPSQLKSLMFSEFNFGRSAEISNNALYMTAALGLQALREQNPGANLFDLLLKIRVHTFTSSWRHNLQAAAMARILTYGLFSKSERSATIAGPNLAVNISVRCNDMAASGNEQHWIDIGNDFVTRYPFTGGNATFHPCIYWTAPVKKMQPFAMASQAGQLLMLQSRYDGITPVEGAQASLEALPNASMIVVENEHSHGLFPYGEACVDAQVANYFLYDRLPARLSSCAGKPLPVDEVTLQPVADDAPSSQSAMVEETAGIYKDAAQAQKIMDRIRRQIGEAAQGFMPGRH